MQGNVTEFTHPLIMHKISLIRDKNCGTREFRTVIGLSLIHISEPTRRS